MSVGRARRQVGEEHAVQRIAAAAAPRSRRARARTASSAGFAGASVAQQRRTSSTAAMRIQRSCRSAASPSHAGQEAPRLAAELAERGRRATRAARRPPARRARAAPSAGSALPRAAPRLAEVLLVAAEQLVRAVARQRHGEPAPRLARDDVASAGSRSCRTARTRPSSTTGITSRTRGGVEVALGVVRAVERGRVAREAASRRRRDRRRSRWRTCARPGRARASSPTSAVESTPPERNAPSGTSDTRCSATASSSSSRRRRAPAVEVERRIGRRVERMPVAPQRRAAVLPDQRVSRLEPAHAAVQRARRRHRAPRQVQVHGVGSRRAIEARPPRAAHPISEPNTRPSPVTGPEQRLDADGIAREHEAPAPLVPEREREHPVELAHEVRAVLLVEVDEHLGVGARDGTGGPAPRVRSRSARVVVDLAVEDDPDRAVLVGLRLGAGVEVDDAQPAEGQPDRRPRRGIRPRPGRGARCAPPSGRADPAPAARRPAARCPRFRTPGVPSRSGAFRPSPGPRGTWGTLGVFRPVLWILDHRTSEMKGKGPRILCGRARFSVEYGGRSADGATVRAITALPGGHEMQGWNGHESRRHRGHGLPRAASRGPAPRGRERRVTAPSSAECDLTRAERARELLASGPDVVFHLAARVGGIGANREHPGHVLPRHARDGAQRPRGGPRGRRADGSCRSAPSAATRSTPRSRSARRTSGPAFRRRRTRRTASRSARSSRDRWPTRRSSASTRSNLLLLNLYGEGDDFDPRTSHVVPGAHPQVRRRDRGGATRSWRSGATERRRAGSCTCSDAVEGLMAAALRLESPDPDQPGRPGEVSIAELARDARAHLRVRGHVRVRRHEAERPAPSRARLLARRGAVRVPRHDAARGGAAPHGRVVAHRARAQSSRPGSGSIGADRFRSMTRPVRPHRPAFETSGSLHQETPVNLLLVNQHYPPDGGATGRLLAQLAERLVHRGHRVTVLTGRPTYEEARATSAPAREMRDGVLVVRVPLLPPPRRADRPHAPLPELRRRDDVRRGSACPGPTWSSPGRRHRCSAARAALAVARFHRCPFVYGVQDVYPEIAQALGAAAEPAARARRPVPRGAGLARGRARRRDRGAACARPRPPRGVDPGRVTVIPNWADTETHPAAHRQRVPARARARRRRLRRAVRRQPRAQPGAGHGAGVRPAHRGARSRRRRALPPGRFGGPGRGAPARRRRACPACTPRRGSPSIGCRRFSRPRISRWFR